MTAPESQGDVTTLLQQASEGNDQAAQRLAQTVQAELRRIAAGYLQHERMDHTLQPTALVNEAWIKLVDQTRVQWESRGHFLAIAATAMRRILVDHARGKMREKRAAPGKRVALHDDAMVAAMPRDGVDLVALDQALSALGEHDSRKVQVIEMRYFAGMSVEQTADALGIAPATVKRDWQFARLWLLRRMKDANS